jgi:GTP-binding protein YchF
MLAPEGTRTMRIGLFGFPKTGKSTLFSLLTGAPPPAHGAREEVRAGVARVPDPRLDRLTEMYHPRKETPATVEYMDIAGVEKGEAADALPLDQLRTADALAHVVRGFRDESIPHVEGPPDPPRDVSTMETELILADHTIASRRIEKLEMAVKKAHRDDDRKELDLLKKCLSALEREVPLRNLEFPEEERRRLRGFTFLSLKPLLVVVNADEADARLLAGGAPSFGLGGLEGRPATEVVALSARIEGEIALLDPADGAAFRAELGIREPALDRMIRGSYRLLGQISFFTVGDDECRAWTIREGTPARSAAGTVHSDMERGFIRAELTAYDDLIAAGSWAACRERGTLRLEGKDYVVRDGDVINFRFGV